MRARKISRGSRTKLSATMADLASIIRLDSNNFNPTPLCLVLDEALELVETPIINPIIHSSSPVLFSYSFKVFHHNLITIEAGNNVFADVMINPSHKPLLPPRNLFKKSFSGLSAFSLKLTTQVSEPPFNLFDLCRIIKPAITGDGEVVYSEIDAKNSILDNRAFDINLFRECEQEEASSLLINSQEAFADFPSEVLFKTIRDVEWNFDSSLNSCKTEDVIFKGSRTGKIISHRSIFNQRFCFSLLDNPTSLLNTSNSQLTLQPISFKSRIDKGVQFDIIPNLFIPSSIDTILQSPTINFDSINYFSTCIDSNFGRSPIVHKGQEEPSIYKYNGGFAGCSAINC